MIRPHVVTGAFGYTWKYIARRLLEVGSKVTTLTGHLESPNRFSKRLSTSPFNFDNPAALARTLEAADTLFNTYWIRFAHGGINHDTAVENLMTLISASEDAGVRRIVHLSITNATLDSSLPCFRGKARVEDAICQSSMSHAILRPTVIFGREDIFQIIQCDAVLQWICSERHSNGNQCERIVIKKLCNGEDNTLHNLPFGFANQIRLHRFP